MSLESVPSSPGCWSCEQKLLMMMMMMMNCLDDFRCCCAAPVVSLLLWLSRQLEFRQRRRHEGENSRSCCWEQLWTPIKPWLVLWWSVSAAALWRQSRSGRVWLLGIYFRGSSQHFELGSNFETKLFNKKSKTQNYVSSSDCSDPCLIIWYYVLGRSIVAAPLHVAS